MQSTLKTNNYNTKADAKIRNNMKLAAQIFDEYGDLIRDIIRFLVNNKSIVDDIFHDVFVSLVHRPVPSHIKNIRGYLCVTVRNDVLDEAIRAKNHRLRNQRYAELHAEQVKSDNPENAVILSDEIQRIFSIIEKRLRPHEAKAIVQKFCLCRDDGRAAEVMGIKKRSFSHYLCTGLRNIRCSEELNIQG